MGTDRGDRVNVDNNAGVGAGDEPKTDGLETGDNGKGVREDKDGNKNKDTEREKDNVNVKINVNIKGTIDTPVKQKRSKSFTGCYTCRRRKIACDLGRPSCLKCKKSGFVCEGYDVKLRWSQPLEFDKYGYQLPAKPNQETEYCQRRSIEYVSYPDDKVYRLYDEMDTDLAKLHNLPLNSQNDNTVIEGHFGVFRGSKLLIKKKKRKSNKQVVKAKKKQKVQTDTVDEKGYTANDDSTNNNISNDNNGKIINMNTSNQYKSLTKNQNFLYPTNVSNSIVGHNTFDHNKNSSVGNEWLSTELLDAALLTASAINGDTHFLDMFDLDGTSLNTNSHNNNSNNNHTFTANNNHSNNNSNLNISTNLNSNSNQQISASNTHNNINSNNGNFYTASNLNSNNTNNHNSTNNNTNNNITHTDNRPADLFNDNVADQMLHLLFQGRNTLLTSQPATPQQQQTIPVIPQSTQNKNQNRANPNSKKNTFFEPQQPASSSLPSQQLPNQNTLANNKSHRLQYSSRRQSNDSNQTASSISIGTRVQYNNQISPEEISSSIQSVDEITSSSIGNSTGIIPTTNQNNKFKDNNQPIINNEIYIHASTGINMPSNIMEILQNVPLPKSLAIDKFGIPTTSLNVHPMARYLLNYYIEDVADMMTVIPLAKNPWKFIYFPRALMAVGELASLGKTSNARNGLLNALLAVSAFNLQSKFIRGSDEMKYYVDLGIQLRRQANEFVNRCMEEDILLQKYKDVLVAVLSMVTIDVVWGTMSSCKIHLDHCEKIIEKKMQHKKKLSSKAIILHRIFSSLKLIQDSTSLENISKSEIFLNEKNYKNFLTGSKPTKEQLEILNNDNYRGIFRGNARSRSNNNNNNNSNSISKYHKSDNNINNPINNYNSNSKNDENEYISNTRSNSNKLNLDNSTANTSSPGSIYQNKSSNNKRGKYNEKITDNGKVRIEFIVNNDDDDIGNNDLNSNADIPAFVDITRTSFKPSKNKLDDKVVSSDAIYGLPNSLILMFGEVIPLTRFKKYHEDHNMILPSFFDELAKQLEFKLLTWKLEWTLIVEDDNNSMMNDINNGNCEQDSISVDETKKNFISPRHEGIYHHVMSFYHALIIYFYRFIEDVNPMYLLERIEKVLYHLNKIQEILEKNKETSYIIPLFWQGFIAGSEAMTLYLQNGFNKWGQDIAQTGIGTYWNARQIMLEIWRRKNHNVKNNSWVDVLRDWKTNVMLT